MWQEHPHLTHLAVLQAECGHDLAEWCGCERTESGLVPWSVGRGESGARDVQWNDP